MPTTASSTAPITWQYGFAAAPRAGALAVAIRDRISQFDDVMATARDWMQLLADIMSTPGIVQQLPPGHAEQCARELQESDEWMRLQVARREQLRSLLQRIEFAPPPEEHQRTLMLLLLHDQAASVEAAIRALDAVDPIVPPSMRARFRDQRCRAVKVRNQGRAFFRRVHLPPLARARRSLSRPRASRRRRTASSRPPATGDPDPDPEPEPPRSPGANTISRAGRPVVALDASDRAALSALGSDLGLLAADLWLDGKVGPR